MGIKSFLSFRNQHTMIFLILLAILVPTMTQSYYPQYKDYAAYGSVGFILLLMAYLPLNARLQAPKYPHIQHTFCIWPSMVTFDRDLYIDMEEIQPAGRIPNVWPLMKMDNRGHYVPMFVDGRFWWPYLAKLRWERDIPSFGDCSYHVFVFPHPWDRFLGFGERPDGAYFQGEVLTLSASEHLESIMAPFKMHYLGIEIPVFLGVMATHTRKKITKGWENTMQVIGRYLGKMDKLIEQEQANIWPNKTLEEMLTANLPAEVKAQMIKVKENAKPTTSE